jgi:hypothetical protein
MSVWLSQANGIRYQPALGTKHPAQVRYMRCETGVGEALIWINALDSIWIEWCQSYRDRAGINRLAQPTQTASTNCMPLNLIVHDASIIS